MAPSKEDLVQGLQEDLAREYKAIIQYVIYSQKLDHAQFMDIATELEKHARQELDHALRIAKQLDYFGAYPTHEPKPVEVSEDSEQMLWFDLRAEDETVRNYRERIRQAESLGEYGLAEELREIIRNEQEHQLDLGTALGVIALLGHPLLLCPDAGRAEALYDPQSGTQAQGTPLPAGFAI
jgi:bacterioferritin